MHNLLFYIFLIQCVSCHLLSDYSKYIPSEYGVISTDLSHFQNITSNEMKNNGPLILRIDFSANETYEIAIRVKNIEVIDWKTDFHIYGENTEDRINIRKENFEVVEGFVISQENSSSIVGYIKDAMFYGTIAFENTVYYIDDLKRYPEIYNKNKNSMCNAVIYKENSLNLSSDSNNYEETMRNLNTRINFIKAIDETELFKSIIGKGKVCTLFVLADYSFLARVHNNDIRSTTLHILNAVEKANSLFRSTDFDEDGMPDNIGFLIKYFVILKSEKTPMNLLPLYSGYPVEGSTYLGMFSQYKLLNEVCLGVAFTGHTFKNDVLGISYTAEPTDPKIFKFSAGGICDRPFIYQAGKNLNTLAISSVLKNGNIVPQYLFDLSLAHELGHSFGSNHDSSKECVGYLMSSHTPLDSHRKRFIFSSCSKESILKTIISKGYCFENYEDPFCGNGIVEEGEDCDCGTTRDCQDLDSCCVPQGQADACKVNKKQGYHCHPSQGICCSSVCTYRNLLEFGLDCKKFTDECPCRETTCSCRVNGKCTSENKCSSEECARISLEECECPTNFRKNMEKCGTCCMYNNVCSPSIMLTKKITKTNDSLFMKLHESKIKQSEGIKKYGVYRTFSNNNISVTLHFRVVNVNEYCLLYGKVGICGTNYKCYTPSVRQIYPSLRTGGSIKKYVCKTLMGVNIFVIIYYMV